MVTTATNVAEIVEARECVRECDEETCPNAGHVGLEKRPVATEEGGELHGKRLFIAAKRSKIETDEDRFCERTV